MVHLPPGTSKWNRIEHRLLSHISMNWRGRPLTSREVIIETIGAVTTKTGLKVQAALDTSTYPKGIRITDKDMKAFEAERLQRHQLHHGGLTRRLARKDRGEEAAEACSGAVPAAVSGVLTAAWSRVAGSRLQELMCRRNGTKCTRAHSRS